ncbi:hypothetical protein JCM11641_007070 [Rhodosporidiobolus odoratus]
MFAALQLLGALALGGLGGGLSVHALPSGSLSSVSPAGDRVTEIPVPIVVSLPTLLLLLSSCVSDAIPLTSAAFPPRPTLVLQIWHGLGDRHDAPGLLSLKADLEAREGLEGVFVHLVRLDEDGAADQRATFFGSASLQISHVCSQLLALPEITSPVLNPSGVFDALGFSQGGQLLRGVVEKCGGKGGLKVRNLITVGSQHMGISAMPPCPPGSGPFSTCRLMHSSLIRSGIYSAWAQHQVVPAQYWREESRIEDYLRVNTFLKDINNERVGDEQVGVGKAEARQMEEIPPSDVGMLTGTYEPRNETYKQNFAQLNRLVLLRFSEDLTVVPPQTAHFTLPHPNATNCPIPPLTADPACYLTPLPWTSLPLYTHDYIGLRLLNEAGKVVKGVCEGAHMEIGEECWEGIVRWFGKRGWTGPAQDEDSVNENTGKEEIVHREKERKGAGYGKGEGELVIQL